MKLKKIIMILFLISILGNIIQLTQLIRLKSRYVKMSNECDKTFEYMNTLTVDSFIDKIKTGETMCVYIGRASCNDCSLFEKILKDIVDKYCFRVNAYYVSVEQYRRSNIERWEKFKKEHHFTQTPVFLFYKNNKLIDSIEWNSNGISEKELVKWLKNNDVI